jgi:hypothetical protein
MAFSSYLDVAMERLYSVSNHNQSFISLLHILIYLESCGNYVAWKFQGIHFKLLEKLLDYTTINLFFGKVFRSSMNPELDIYREIYLTQLLQNGKLFFII